MKEIDDGPYPVTSFRLSVAFVSLPSSIDPSRFTWLGQLRRDTHDTYQYEPSKVIHMEFHYGPPERPLPWRPNGS